MNFYYSMNIALIGSFNFHLECIAFLLEIFKNDNVVIYLSNHIDIYNYIKYYKTIYTFDVKYIDIFSKDIIDQNDLTIKLTSNDKCLDDNRILSILHLNGKDQLDCKSTKFLSLTPYISGSNIYYTFPIYNPILTNNVDNKIIVLIGYYLNQHFDEDTIKFINMNSDYTFHFVVWGSGDKYSNINNIKNIQLYNGLDTSKLVNLIDSSKYILSKKKIKYDRFSGQLGLSISYEKPMLIDKRTKDSYNLPGFVFDKNYSELGSLNNIDDSIYQNVKNEIKIFKENTLKNNKMILQSLL